MAKSRSRKKKQPGRNGGEHTDPGFGRWVLPARGLLKVFLISPVADGTQRRERAICGLLDMTMGCLSAPSIFISNSVSALKEVLTTVTPPRHQKRSTTKFPDTDVFMPLSHRRVSVGVRGMLPWRNLTATCGSFSIHVWICLQKKPVTGGRRGCSARAAFLLVGSINGT